jgi:hypothetical protein
LKLELNTEKTLITNAYHQKAKFLGYEVHTIHEDSKHDHRGRRCINRCIGLRVPTKVREEKCKRYMKNGKPIHLPERTIDDAYSIVSAYQAEYKGIVQYYRMAYNLHTLNKLRYVAEVSLVKTLATKYRTTCTKIYGKYGVTIKTEEGNKKVILVKHSCGLEKPLITHFGGISLKWNKLGNPGQELAHPVWNTRSELVQRLKAQKCELCGSQEKIEVHHIRKLADIEQKGRTKPAWKKWMIARKRKTLVVCQKCHRKIHHGKYDGRKLTA